MAQLDSHSFFYCGVGYADTKRLSAALGEWVEHGAGLLRPVHQHHERLDGRGYHKGVSGENLSLEVRILAVADMYEALAARRPYRPERTSEEAITIINREVGTGLCPIVVSALKTFLAQSRFVPYKVAA